MSEKENKKDKRIGNQYWRLAKKHGQDLKLDPEELKEKAVEYFNWTEDNPLVEEKMTSGGKIRTVNKMRAMTKKGLCIYCGITYKTYLSYSERKEYKSICNSINMIIEIQKFEGAAAGLLNANIISRDLGMIDKQEIKSELTVSRINTIKVDMHKKPLEKPDK